MDGRLDELADRILAADRVVALTGAGVSTASGIPDFRGDDGVWNGAFDPDDFHVERFRADPAGFWRDRVDLHDHLFGGDAAPNAAHRALVRLERAGSLDAVVTQNTDGLHAAAGTEDVVELHGNAARAVCSACGHAADTAAVVARVRGDEVPPRCPECGGVYRPDVVLFGERLPESALGRARRLARDGDVFLAVGSSLTVDPAASLPGDALDAGATLAVVNLDATRYGDVADFDLRADVTDALPALADRVTARTDDAEEVHGRDA